MSLELEVVLKSTIRSVESPTHPLTRVGQERVMVNFVHLPHPCTRSQEFDVQKYRFAGHLRFADKQEGKFMKS